MSSLLYRINSVLSRVVDGVPLGTNLGLFPLLWMLLSGRLLQSRGAVIPGLAALPPPAAPPPRRRAALAYGTRHTPPLPSARAPPLPDAASSQPPPHAHRPPP